MSRGRWIVGLVSLLLLVAGCAAPQEEPATGEDDPSPSEQTGQAGSSTPDSDDEIVPEEVQGGQGSGGGKVKNSAPEIQAFSVDQATGQNDGAFRATFSATVFDRNTEQQLKELSIASTGADVVTSTHTITNQERGASSEPSSFGNDDWKVWSGTSLSDGVLEAKFQHTFAEFAPSGVYAFTLTVTDRSGETAASAEVTVTIESFSRIEVGAAPVLANGSADTTAGWGGWDAEAGGTDVSSVNYLKLVNTGDVPGVSVVIDFNEAAFTGANETNDISIPIDGNIRFATFEDTTPATTAPDEGTYTFSGASGSGSVTVQFTGQGNVVYVAYQLASLPDVLPIDTYSSSFTVTEL